MKAFKSHLVVYLKGVAMGAADVVPGVSGGTVAFITGIYEKLVESIKSIEPRAVRLLFKEGPAAFWDHINGTFLLVLALGVGTSIVTLARVITDLLDKQPELLWSFFFGLILVSSIYAGRRIKNWGAVNIGVLLIGGVVGYLITVLAPARLEPDNLTLFVAGAIAICAMILPGISGSFILLMMGLYGHVIGAIKDFQLSVLGLFAAGAVTGLLGFSHLLSWLLKRYHDTTMALLTGFMVGSLNKVWPWKETIEYRVNSHGEQAPFLQQNVLPQQYLNIVGEDPKLIACVLLMTGAIGAVLVLEKWASMDQNG